MTASRLTAATRPSKQYSSRSGVVPTVLQLHHGATTNAEWMISVMVSGSKQVSANYVCDSFGRLTNVVDEVYRAWTSSSAIWDRKSITVETANLSANGWTISDAAHEALAQLAADCSKRYGWGRLNRSGPFSTWNVIGHREINQHTGQSYATACPGAMDLDRVVRRANEILAGPAPAPTPAPTPSNGSDDDVSFADKIKHNGVDASAEVVIANTLVLSEQNAKKLDDTLAKLDDSLWVKHNGIDAPVDVVSANALISAQIANERLDALSVTLNAIAEKLGVDNKTP